MSNEKTKNQASVYSPCSTAHVNTAKKQISMQMNDERKQKALNYSIPKHMYSKAPFEPIDQII